MKYTPIGSAVALGLLTLAINGCGSSSQPFQGSTDTTPTTVAVGGTVSAPAGGTIAFIQPSAVERFFTSILGGTANAAIEGVAPVGAGVTVNLIEVDNSGTQVALIASAITDANGAYSIDAPEGFVPGSQFVVRAVGTSTNLDARVSSLTPDVDPLTNASSTIIADQSMDLSQLSTTETDEIYAAIEEIAQNIDPTGLSASEITTELKTEATADEEVSNIVASTAATGQICGNVTDSNAAAVANIRIVVRDYGNWVTRAKAKTDANGDYCLNVPLAGEADPNINGATLSGDYILGAINFTSTSMAASQWWTSTSEATAGTGGANNQFGADKISVPDTTTITRNFVLDANGARIEGTVTGSDNTPLEGMRVLIRNYDTFKPLSAAKVKADGSYRINVKATDYLISFRNNTRFPFASEIYRSGTNGANDRNMGSRETLSAGMTYTYDAVLDPGAIISGLVTDNLGTAIPGAVVSVDNTDGGRIEKMRTNKAGKFRIWVNPRLSGTVTEPAIPYTVSVRGQTQNADTNGGDDMTKTNFSLKNATGLTFNAAVATVTGTLVAADGTTPVSEAVMFLKQVTTNNGTDTGAITSIDGTQDLQVSNADGTFTLYTDTVGTYVLAARMDSDLNYGSGVYDGSTISATAMGSGQVIYISDINTPFAAGDIMVPTLGTGNSVGYLEGNAGAGSTTVMIRIGGNNSGLFNMVTTASRGDGSFKITLPATTYDRVRSQAGTGGNCDTVVIGDGLTATLNFDGTVAPPCAP